MASVHNKKVDTQFQKAGMSMEQYHSHLTSLKVSQRTPTLPLIIRKYIYLKHIEYNTHIKDTLHAKFKLSIVLHYKRSQDHNTQILIDFLLKDAMPVYIYQNCLLLTF